MALLFPIEDSLARGHCFRFAGVRRSQMMNPLTEFLVGSLFEVVWLALLPVGLLLATPVILVRGLLEPGPDLTFVRRMYGSFIREDALTFLCRCEVVSNVE